MNLDPRIIEGKKPLDCFDTEIAKQFIGKEGYFTDCLVFFTNIRLNEKCMLTAIDEKAQSCFKDVDGVRWDWFLPAEWVKEPEKKFRPYKDVEEFFNDVGCTLGDVIRFRKKDTTEEEYHTLLTGFKGDARVNIGLGDGGYYSLNDLFSLFELYTADGWKPFGVLDD